MKCNKCGEEYGKNQAFCLKCGNPIQVVPDFNLIEAQLANNVEELMDDEPVNQNTMSDNFSEYDERMVTIDVPIEDINMGLKMVDINRERFSFDDDYEVSKPKRPEHPKQNTNRRPVPKKKKSTAAKNVLIILGCLISLTVIIFLMVMIITSDSCNNSTKFQEYFDSAKEYYEGDKKTEALDNAKKAVEASISKREELEARTLLYDIHVKYEVQNEEYIENIKTICTMDDYPEEFCEAALAYYYDNDMVDELNKFHESIPNQPHFEKYIPEYPVPDKEPGKYDEYIKVTLKAEKKAKIYYTIDGSNPKESGIEYKEPISIDSEKEVVIKTYAVSEKGVNSVVMDYEYTIGNVEIAGPSVSPSSGAYQDYTKIEITVPEGSKAYYTLDGTEPTETSEEYTEPFDMPLGSTDLQVILVDEAGKKSDVTTVYYNLSLPRNINITDAEKLVDEVVSEEKGLDKKNKDKESGSTYNFRYATIVVIDNREYYIVKVIEEKDEEELSVAYKAVNTFDETVINANEANGEYTIPEGELPEEEESEETEE